MSNLDIFFRDSGRGRSCPVPIFFQQCMWKSVPLSNPKIFFQQILKRVLLLNLDIFFSKCGRGPYHPVPNFFSADVNEGATVKSQEKISASLEEGTATGLLSSFDTLANCKEVEIDEICIFMV